MGRRRAAARRAPRVAGRGGRRPRAARHTVAAGCRQAPRRAECRVRCSRGGRPGPAPPAFADVLAAAPHAWRLTLRELDALGARCGVQGRVFGGLAWQALTGDSYLSASSDLDVLFPLPAASCIAPLLDGLATIAARAPMRIDGELLRDDGAGVNWRELQARLPEVAVKTAIAVELMPAAAFAGDAP
ncbi:malonate decarboxylase holo-[acyl-carrier-protein] synthase [Burkholderia multivorans]|uniref:malonate decarboxylase holo-[acyl-carrier-protein] synthase n=1 Tax=Burkholderia multivorans TaxID=87883 RepID=UPI001F1513F2|nr:malonate decarboxylase holo-[acyl-carrier-protein] synthase [Burkholderia multivorans]